MLSRQLEEYGLPLVAGGLADQPVGYLADVSRVRGYLRACEAKERELDGEGNVVSPCPAWAEFLLLQVAAALADEDGDANPDPE